MLVHPTSDRSLTLQPDNRVFVGDVVMRLAELSAPRLPGTGAVAVVDDDPLVQLATVVHLFRAQRWGIVLPRHRLNERTEPVLTAAGFTIVGDGGLPYESPHDESGSGVALMTSGTTGPPKLYRHRWASLSTHPGNVAPRHWLNPYSAGSYAWYQLVTLWMFVPEQTLTLVPDADPVSMIEAAVRSGVDAISCTPSFWRHVLLSAPPELLKRLQPTQLTLGGERVEQAILDELGANFPEARITHIYASTETGAAIVVHDGREGFPVDWLERARPGRPELRITDEILHVRSPFAAEATGEWWRTGDRVERRGDRVVIVGREGEGMLNVGGRKASKAHLEQAIRQHPDIAWCRVYTRRSPVAGSVVTAQVVPRRPIDDAEAFGDALSAFCRAQNVEDWTIPRFWNIEERIP